MGFWTFMLICSLLLPIIMIVIGFVFQKHPPKTINGIYGYRTDRSRRNQDTWDFAHAYCGKLWWKIGWGMLIVTILVMLLLIGRSQNMIGWGGGIVELIQCIVLTASIAPVEHALKKNFG